LRLAEDTPGAAPSPADANLLHPPPEGKVLEAPARAAPPSVYQRTPSPMAAPDAVSEVSIGFARGDAVSLNGKPLSPATLLATLNQLGHDNGIGRVDLVEYRFVVLK